MKHLTFFFGLLLLTSIAAVESFATNYTDSLKKKLATTSDYEARFTIYELLFNDIIDKDPEIGEYYLTECFAIAKKANSKKLLLKAEVLKVLTYYATEKYSQFNKEVSVVEKKLLDENFKQEYYFLNEYIVKSYMLQSNYLLAAQRIALLETQYNQITDQKLLCRIEVLAGECYNLMGNKTSAIASLQKALEVAEKGKYYKSMCYAALLMGSIYNDGPNKDFALKYLLMGADLANAQKDTSLIMQAQMVLGNFYFSENKFQKALEKYENLMPFLNKEQEKNTYAGLLGNLGNTYWELGEKEKGLKLQEEALAMFIDLGDKQGQTICYNAIGECYRDRKDYLTALEYYKKSLAIAIEMNSFEDLVEVHLNLSKTYEATNDF